MTRLKILLINAMPKGSLSPPFPVLPLGLACISAIARKNNADVKIISGTDAPEKLNDLLSSWQPDCAGFQTFINNRELTITLAKAIRKGVPEALIICGGVQATNDPSYFLKSGSVDAVIPGEGELLFEQFLNCFHSSPLKAPGLIHMSESKEIVTNPGKGLYENLDDLPPMPFDLFYSPGSSPVGHLLTHRGCPFHCSHCPLRFRAGVPIRSHSAQRVVEQVTELNGKYGVKHIEFYDENFTMDHQHVRDICAGIADIPVSFSCTARVSQVDMELCHEMEKAGCTEIVFGLGTGVKRLQDILGTHEDLEHSRDLIAELASTRIQPVAVFSMGIPTETHQEFKETIQYALSLKKCRLRFEPAAPLPGSQLHKTAQSGGRFMIKSWNEYTKPGQLVYLPAGWRKFEFLIQLYRAKLLSKIKYRRENTRYSQKGRFHS